MHEILSSRILSMPASATLAMNQKAALLRQEGHDVIDLSLGEPDFLTPSHIRQAATEAIEDGKCFSYPPVAGYMELRQAVVRKLHRENGVSCTPDQVVITNGAKQALINALLCCVNPGDEVIVYTPYWVSYISMIQLVGGVPVRLQGSAEDGFEPTEAQLEAAVTKRTRAILFSNPCNPTGHVFSKFSLECIVGVLQKHPHVLAISDEIYEPIRFGQAHISLAALPGAEGRVITVNGFSKGFAMTGWRIGYLVAPQRVAKACEKLQGQMTSGVCGVAQKAALAALTGEKEPVQTMVEAYRRRRDLCLELLQQHTEFEIDKTPMGAFYLFVNANRYLHQKISETAVSDTDALCMLLLERAHVALVGGAAFGVDQYIRISYAASEALLREAFHRLKPALSALSASPR